MPLTGSRNTLSLSLSYQSHLFFSLTWVYISLGDHGIPSITIRWTTRMKIWDETAWPDSSFGMAMYEVSALSIDELSENAKITKIVHILYTVSTPLLLISMGYKLYYTKILVLCFLPSTFEPIDSIFDGEFMIFYDFSTFVFHIFYSLYMMFFVFYTQSFFANCCK